MVLASVLQRVLVQNYSNKSEFDLQQNVQMIRTKTRTKREANNESNSEKG